MTIENLNKLCIDEYTQKCFDHHQKCFDSNEKKEMKKSFSSRISYVFRREMEKKQELRVEVGRNRRVQTCLCELGSTQVYKK